MFYLLELLRLYAKSCEAYFFFVLTFIDPLYPGREQELCLFKEVCAVWHHAELCLL
jgi:hypothetical protein